MQNTLKEGKKRRNRFLVLIIGLGVLITVFAGLSFATVDAAPQPQTLANDTCYACHSREGLVLSFPNGDQRSLTVSPDMFRQSAHYAAGVTCTTCHSKITEYPHAPFPEQSNREYTLNKNLLCQSCHAEQFSEKTDDVHKQALESGNQNAATCSDCHNPHTQPRVTDEATGSLLPDARVFVSQSCVACHSAIYEKYERSVHGAALREGNPDVPSCVDCHGSHNLASASTLDFRLASPRLCSDCHTNPEIMDKYGLSTDVYDTYVADFHGATVVLFARTHPEQDTNKPMCYDCHGVHDIMSIDDPASGLAIRENLLITCQKCHPGATANFSDSWLGHYRPDVNRYPIVFFVDLFYRILIPLVLGGMTIFVITDAIRRFVINRRKGATH